MKLKIINCMLLAALLGMFYVPACYLVAERDNPNDPENWGSLTNPIADTGQTFCYDTAGTVIACNQDVAGWPRQDGFYADKPKARSFTEPTQYATTSDYTTKDNVTGLVWKSCSQGWDGAACANDNADPNTYTWADALTACTALNILNSGAGYAGRKTWRLPAIEELSTLPNYGIINPAIDTGSFPNTQASLYWSSSTNVGSAGYAWVVFFLDGVVLNGDKTDNVSVRCVADGP